MKFSVPTLKSVVAIVLVVLPVMAHAFSPAQQTATLSSTTRLNAWTLPNPVASASHTSNNYNVMGMFKATWYDDHHPTARKVVYNDDDQSELYRFVVPFSGDSWSTSVFDADEADNTAHPRRRLRRVAAWAMNRVRRFAA